MTVRVQRAGAGDGRLGTAEERVLLADEVGGKRALEITNARSAPTLADPGGGPPAAGSMAAGR